MRSVRRPGDERDAVLAAQHSYRQPAFGVPDAYRIVPGRGQVVAVRRPRQSGHRAFVADQGALEGAGLSVPDADDAVVPAGRELPPVGADGQIRRTPPVSFRLDPPAAAIL